MTCPKCKGTGKVRIPLFTSVVEERCKSCGGVLALGPPPPNVRFACGGTAGADAQWLGGMLRCSLGHWHTRGEYIQAKAA